MTLCCNKRSLCRRHEKKIHVPELVGACGAIYPHRTPFSLSWLYTKMAFWSICSSVNIYCYVTCFLDTNYYAYFLYYNSWVLLLSWFYFSLSLILTIRIYQTTQPYLLPSCLQPLNQYARSDINDLPSLQNLKLSVLAKYTNIAFHLCVTNTFVLCIAYWTVEFIHSIHSFEHFYKLTMQLNVVGNYAVLLLIVLFDFAINASKFRYSAIWYILIMSVVFHVWSSVFNYNAFMYHNDNDNMHADITKLPSLFIYYNWDQTKENTKIVSHSIGYIVAVSIVLYLYIIITHCILCFVKSVFLYRWSLTHQAIIENAFDTEFELNEFSDATAGDEDAHNHVHAMYNEKAVGNGIVVHDKLKDTENLTNPTGQSQEQQQGNEVAV